jgi:hypothetical protein
MKVALALDRFLDLYRSRRKWRIKFVILGLDLAPLLAGGLPLRWMSREARRSFVHEKLRGGKGLWAKVAMGRQLILLAYYGARRSERRMGFVPFARRDTARRLLRLAPVPGARR